jgi:hypothetical protein
LYCISSKAFTADTAWNFRNNLYRDFATRVILTE